MQKNLISYRPFKYFLLLLLLTSLACQTTSPRELVGKGAFTANKPDAAQENVRERLAPGLIAYIGVDRNVYIVDANGRGVLQLTDDAEIQESLVRSYRNITWSPDSSGLAFVGLEATGHGSDSSLFLADVSSGDVMELFSSEDISPFYLHFSPDSRSVAFLSANPTAGSLGLFLVPDEPAEPQIVENGQPFYWAWAPDSMELFAHIGGRLTGRLAFLNPSADSRDDIDLQPTAFQAPTFLPDGNQLIVAIENEGADNLALINRDGSIAKILAALEPSAAFVLSPTGDKVAYTTSDFLLDSGAIGELAIIDVHGDEVSTRIGGDLVVAFFWSPDGTKLAYMSIDPDGRQQAKLANQNEQEVLLDLFLFDLETEQSRYLHSFVPTRALLNVIPYFDQYHLSTTFWSPNSRYMVMPTFNPDAVTSQILLIDTHSESTPTTLVDGILAFWSWD